MAVDVDARHLLADSRRCATSAASAAAGWLRLHVEGAARARLPRRRALAVDPLPRRLARPHPGGGMAVRGELELRGNGAGRSGSRRR